MARLGRLWRRTVRALRGGLILRPAAALPAPSEGGRNHVLIVDGTQSRLTPGEETNAGLLYKLLQEAACPRTTLWYHAGIQGHGLRNWVTLASGWGINQIVFDGYATLARRYRPGDRIFFFGFSRGAYAVRSIAGMIDRVGLVQERSAHKGTLREAFALYERGDRPGSLTFQSVYCHSETPVRMIGVWDTVAALGLPYPLLRRLAPMATEFHDTNIGLAVEGAFQALALHETRNSYRPVMWNTPLGWKGTLSQCWFAGAHGDVGGHVWRDQAARPLANIPFRWMATQAARQGLPLPNGWEDRFPTDPHAPMVGAQRGIARFFLLRGPRPYGIHPGEHLHPSAVARGALPDHVANHPRGASPKHL